MHNIINILKKVKVVLLVVALMAVASTFNIFAGAEVDAGEASATKNQEADTVYLIRNPKNYSQVITDAKGKILVKAIDPDNEFLSIVEDRYNDNKNLFLTKTIMGEKMEREVYDEESGASYPYPSSRVIFYDLKGNKILESNESSRGDYYSGWNGKLIYKDINKLNIYDFETNENKTSELLNFQTLNKDKLMIYNSEWDNGVKRLEIYDKDMNLLKTLDNVAFEYDNEINKKPYHKVRVFINEGEKLKEEAIEKGTKEVATGSEVIALEAKVDDEANEKRYYNFIDDDGNFYFEHHIENEVYGVDTDIVDFYYDDMYFTYDMANRKYVVEPTKMTAEKKQEIDEKYRGKNDRDNDPNVKKLQEKLKEDGSFVDRYEYNNKVIYISTYGGHMINEDTDNAQYLEYHDLYDANLNLLKEKDEEISISLIDYGYIVIGDTIYDFDMNEVRKTDGYVNFNVVKINDKPYIVDMYDKNYKKKERMSLYDEKFNEKLSNKNDIMIYYDFPYIFATDEESTKVYDENLNFKKDLGRKYEVNPWYNKDHLVLIDKETGRYSISSNEGQMEVRNLKEVSDLRDEYFTFLNGFKYGIMDYKGNILVSLSIFNTMKEDVNPRDYDSTDFIE